MRSFGRRFRVVLTLALEPPLPPRRRFRNRSGSSLLEIIIATLLVSITVLALVAFFAKGRVWFDHEEHKRVATLLAQEAMERSVSMPFAQILPWQEQRTVAMVRYSIAVTMEENTPEPDMKTVRSRVTWSATPSAQRSVSLATLVHNH
jgi:Tfp pilus assembly protein PilV